MISFFKDFGSGNTTPGNHWLFGIGASTVACMAAENVILFRIMQPAMYSLFSKQKWWDYLKTYKGLFCTDVQVEIQYTSLLSVHHLFGGYLMLHGLRHQKPEFFAAGTILELADDFHDTILMLCGRWPFKKLDMKITTLMLVHHFAGISCIVPVLTSGMYLNVHVQKIGAALLCAGGTSLAILTASRTRNRTNAAHARHDAALWIASWSMTMYTRWYIFPAALLALFREEYRKLTPPLRVALVSFTTLMSLFNIATLLDGTQQTIERIRLAWKLTMRSK